MVHMYYNDKMQKEYSRVFSRDILKGGIMACEPVVGLGGVLSFGKYNTLLLLPI